MIILDTDAYTCEHYYDDDHIIFEVFDKLRLALSPGQKSVNIVKI